MLAAVAAFSAGCDAMLLHSNTSTPVFMLVAGVSSPEEMCLLESTGRIGLSSCAAAVAAGDGRELWSISDGGQLVNAASKKCASAAAGATMLSVLDCRGASTWKLLAGGQVQVGDRCLSQSGQGVGIENVAAHAAVVATSSANAASHAAAAAVDADDATFWASKPGDAGPTELTIDIGEARHISTVKIAWESIAQSFSVSVSSDGSSWTEVFATTVNVEQASIVPIGLTASRVRLEMSKPLGGASSGRPLFGIKTVVALAPRMAPSLDDCSAASSSTDARDKYFPVAVSDFDLSASATLHAELPALASARTSLSTALSEVAALPGCSNGAVMLAAASVLSASSETLRANDVADGGGSAEVEQLLATARSIIVGAREAML